MLFSVAGVAFYKSLSKSTEVQVMGRRFLRSCTSVGANTRSAFRGRSKKEYVAKLGIVIEEADECGFWLEHMIASGTVKETDAIALLRGSNELVAISTTLTKR